MSTLLDQLLTGLQQAVDSSPTAADDDMVRYISRLLSDSDVGYSEMCNMTQALYDTVHDAVDKVGRLPVEDNVLDALTNSALLTVIDTLHISLSGVSDSADLGNLGSLIIDDTGAVMGTTDGVGKSIRSLYILLDLVFQWGAISGAVGQRDMAWSPMLAKASKKANNQD